jgi:glycerophosphoryl diester phosphodiesterase
MPDVRQYEFSSHNRNERTVVGSSSMIWKRGYSCLNRPAVIAHGGASAIHPPNSLDAFRFAKTHGADVLEADLRLTADNQVVCLHGSFIVLDADEIPVNSLTYRDIARRVPGLATLEKIIGLDLPVYLDVKETTQESVTAILRVVSNMEKDHRFIIGVRGLEESKYLRRHFARISQVALMLDDYEIEQFAAESPGHWVRLHEPRAVKARVEHLRARGVNIMITCGSDASRTGHLDLAAIPGLIELRPDALVVNNPGQAISEIVRAQEVMLRVG